MARKNKAFDQSKYAQWIDPQQAKPYERNAKEHTEKQIKNIANSIRRFGWQQDTVLTTDNVLVIGHGRRLAAIQLGCMMPYHVIDKIADELTDEDIRELRIADNQTNAETGLDLGTLQADIADLDFDGFDFDFDLAGEQKEIIDTDVPDVPNTAKTKKGDIWQLGNHRLMCGDSTNHEDVANLMGTQHSKLLFTSPPYSDLRDYGGDKNLDVSNISQFISVYKDYASIQAVNLGIKISGSEIQQYWDKYIDIAKQSGLKLLAWNVWDKLGSGSIGQQQAFVPIRHEFIFCFGEKPIELYLTWEKREGSIYSNNRRRKVRQKDGSMKESSCGISNRHYKKMESVLEIPDQEYLESVTKQASEKGKIRSKHPATFSIYLPCEYILAMTKEGDAVIEPFGGSGTTLMACEQLDRICYAMELDEKYCDVIIERWETFTGEKAVLLNGER